MSSRALKNWIQGAVKKPGSLHKALRVPKGEKIPQVKLDKALHSKSKLMRQRAQFAQNVKGLRK